MSEFHFDNKSADRARKFIESFCCQSKGQFAGKPLTLLPWQWEDVVKPLFGQKRADNTRRYRHAGIWVPKKQGKSTLASALALYMLIADGEPGAEVYIIANDIQQSSIVFSECANMVEQSPLLAKSLEVVRSTKRILHGKSRSILRALSSEKAGKHGYNASCLIWDELAFQQDRELWDILRYATAFRRQPLTISISTAGYDRENIGFEQYRYAKDVKEGKTKDPYFLPCIYEAEEKDDWTKEATWKKANPSLGHTIPLTDFQEAVKEALAEPRKEANFRALRLNQWVGHSDQWISSRVWDACGEAFDIDMLAGRDCYAGVDLARKHDLASYVLVFPVDDLYYLLPRFFIPKDLAIRKTESDHVDYLLWARQKHLTLTDGDVIDYTYIREQMKQDAERYNVIEVGYDPYGAEQLCNQQLSQEDGMDVVEVRQGMLTMSPPTSQFDKLLKEKRIRHGSNPVLNWNSQNVVVREDVNDNIMPDKRRSTSRIDGIVAAIIGLSRALAADGESSAYNDRAPIIF